MARSKLVGAYLTAKHLGPGVLVKEVLRRVLGKPYRYRGLEISRDTEFRLIRGLVMRGFEIYADSGQAVVETNYGVVRVGKSDFSLLGVLGENYEKQYGVADVEDGVVVDVGAFIGDTVFFFLSKGARKVYAYEPIRKYYAYLLENVEYSGVKDRVVAENKAVWYTNGMLRIPVCGAGSGLCEEEVEGIEEVEAVALSEVLSSISRIEGEIDLVKMDCEGCEIALLYTDPTTLRIAGQYIVEIHSNHVDIVRRMEEAGFKTRLVHMFRGKYYIYYFTVST